MEKTYILLRFVDVSREMDDEPGRYRHYGKHERLGKIVYYRFWYDDQDGNGHLYVEGTLESDLMRDRNGHPCICIAPIERKYWAAVKSALAKHTGVPEPDIIIVVKRS